ncbi:helix-turn-helix domain-containing protein [Methylobacterium sp. J-067]|uniref:helix-turn-helix domain-containing protein n=1 Tax=Methylobacterium sp. J-067 TaxID=2836648 RepID=UPI001FB96847|nr:helix-turn-helix domain-containing protein [Methylobacterium sp. J-067]MCJ2023930.1 helix-turn-helix domain-containing protein [Methylobacterium sp. J-067]
MSDDIMDVLTRPTVDVVLAGRVLGISRNTAYKAVRDGSLPSIRLAGQFRVPTASLREMLGLPSQPPSGLMPNAA